MNISHEEERWVERESAISDLLENIEDKCRETGKIREPHMILKNAHDVYSKLKLQREPVLFKVAEYPKSLDTNQYFRKEKMNLEMPSTELEMLLRKFTKIHEYVKTQFKS